MTASGFSCALFSEVGVLTLLRRVEVEVINARRRWIIDQLSALIRNGSISKTGDWVESVLDWFIVNGLFVVKKKSEKSQYIGVCYSTFLSRTTV